ncbi:MAG: DUF4340 domain-containing protein [Nitrospirae bacterium]|nr:DUF4340 domain-containing protein [Nitrospirota bacterium]
MKDKKLIILISTALLLIAAFFIVNIGTDKNITKQTSKNVFFIKDYSKIDKIIIQNKTDNLELDSKDNSWYIANKYKYRADIQKVADFMESIAAIQPIQEITKNREFHKRLGLSFPNDINGEGTEITLSSQGRPLIVIVTGNSRKDVEGSISNSGQYARKFDEDNVYLLEQKIEAKTDPLKWINRHILNINEEDIAVINIIGRSKSDSYKILRVKKGDKLVLEDHSGKKVKDASLINLSLTFADINIDDVFDAGNSKFKGIILRPSAVIELFNGMVYTFNLAEVDKKSFIKIVVTNTSAGDSKEAISEQGLLQDWIYVIPLQVKDSLIKKKSELFER